MASDSTPASSPRWASTAGSMPAARSRSSSTAARALANAESTSSASTRRLALEALACELGSIMSATSRCWAPSCRSRPSRRRSASPASTIRARDARSASSRARSSTSRRPFSIASAAAAVASLSSSGASHTAASWTSAPTRRPRWLISVVTRPSGSSGAARPRRRRSARREPVGDGQRRVVERDPQRVAQRAGIARKPLDQAPERGGAEEARAHETGEERDREQRERGEEGDLAGDAVLRSRLADCAVPWNSASTRIAVPSPSTGSSPRRWIRSRHASVARGSRRRG